jgi:hypothetical protein
MIGLLFVSCFLYPFWLLGPYSLLGFYDEVDGQVPWIYTNLINSSPVFLHQIVGGTPYVLGGGSEYVSIYKILQSEMSLWQANLVFRFFGLFSLFSGLYLLIIKILPDRKVGWTGFVLILFGISTSYISYGWVLGGHGWDLSVVVWLSLASLGVFKSKNKDLFAIVILAAIVPLVSNPIFSLPLTLYFLVFLFFINTEVKEKYKARMYHTLLLYALLLTFFVLNYFNIYYLSYWSKGFSARILGTLQPTDVLEMSGLIKLKYSQFLGFFNNFSIIYLVPAFVVLSSCTLLTKRYRTVVLILIFSLIIPFFLSVGLTYSEIPVVGSYRWSILLYLMPLFLIIGFNVEFSNSYKIHCNKLNSKYKAVYIINIVLIVLIFMATNSTLNYAMNSLKSKAGAGVAFFYEALNSFEKNNKDSYRVVSDYGTVQWALPLYYGYKTYDGYQPAASHRRSYFNANAIFINPQKKYHTSKHFFKFYSDAKKLNYNALSMVGVKYIFSARPRIFELNKPVLSIKGAKTSNFNKWYREFLELLVGDISLVKPLNVFSVDSPWALVFSVSKLRISNKSYASTEFYDELGGIDFESALVAAEDANDFQNLVTINSTIKPEVLSVKYTDEGYKVRVKSSSGYIVFNQVYIRGWKGFCDGEKAPLIPVNGIMMALKINKGCKIAELKYE